MNAAPNPREFTPSSAPVPSFTWSAEQTARELATDLHSGLTAAEAARRQQSGFNELPEVPPDPFWKKLLRQFSEVMIWLLIVAAVISGVLGDWIDAVAIFAIIAVNTGISLFQEEKAGRALAALRKLSPPVVKVLRNGGQQSLPARELVPGDVIELEAGDYVPADARLTQAFVFQVAEAALTGESTAVEKDAHLVLPVGTPLADRRNMVFMGTIATGGKANAVVVATGAQTELGKIAGMLERFTAAPTPLERRLRELGKLLVVVCLVIVAIIFALQVLRGGNLLEMVVVSISLAVAAVPEGMPAVVTLTLAIGLQRMVKRNAIVRKLASVETLGSVTVICTDKTGTLTRNEMTVQEIATGGKRFQVTGIGYTPQGEFFELPRQDDQREQQADPANERDLFQTLTIGVKCNHAHVQRPAENSNKWQIIGDPTEGALLVAALKAGIEPSAAQETVYEIPFDSQRKAMSVALAEPEGTAVLYTKGAPEVILAKSVAELSGGKRVELTAGRKQQISQASAEMAARALRVLALAYRPLSAGEAQLTEEANLIFAGLVGMLDPPREEAREAVRKCCAAGIRPVMITGDHPATALAIAEQLQLAPAGTQAITGAELDAMTDGELLARAPSISVYARVAAEHKMRVVQALQRHGEVVAMTGDGVNDAPAIKSADVGIAMGVTGSDVTKEAADVVLADDNFASIVNAVEEGRGIFDNIQKFVHYLLSCNAGEVLLMFFAALVGWPVPLTALQILWINLVTDGLPALALGAEPPERDIMRRPPRVPHEPVITLRRGGLILLHGALIAAVAIVSFWLTYRGDAENIALARSVAFCTIAFAQLFFSIACRSQRFTMPELGLFSNRFLFWAIAISATLQLLVSTGPIAERVFDAPANIGARWPLVLALALIPVTLVEFAKLLRSKLRRREKGEE